MELKLAVELQHVEDRQERFRRWHEQTGKSEPTLYRRLAEAEQTEDSQILSDN
jgi:hypothetical protein